MLNANSDSDATADCMHDLKIIMENRSMYATGKIEDSTLRWLLLSCTYGKNTKSNLISQEIGFSADNKSVISSDWPNFDSHKMLTDRKSVV